MALKEDSLMEPSEGLINSSLTFQRPVSVWAIDLPLGCFFLFFFSSVPNTISRSGPTRLTCLAFSLAQLTGTSPTRMHAYYRLKAHRLSWRANTQLTF
jgi:hypothetical protein